MAEQEDTVRVLRVIEYIGPRSVVERCIERSIQGTKIINGSFTIRAATIGSYPEIPLTQEAQDGK